MAMEVFPDSPKLGRSPRISFSYDLPQNDVAPVEQYIRSSSSSIDFDFCVFRGSFDQESSSADELFSDGKILPIEIKRRLTPPRKSAAPSLPPPPLPTPTEIKETVSKSSTPSEKKNPGSESVEKQSCRKSWFKRSTSLNCGSGYARTLCPLPLLSRSNSTGSTSNSGKRSSVPSSRKQSLLKSSAPNSLQKLSQSAYSSKPPLKKSSNNAFYSNGVKFNPVLNVPPANLFGLGTIFSGGRDKSRKKVIN